MPEADTKVERLKALALDLLGGSGQWMTYPIIYWEHYEADGEVDEPALRAALDQLVDCGKVQIVGGDGGVECRIARPQEGESLADKVRRLEAERDVALADVERLRSRDAKFIADMKAVEAWTGDGDVEALDPLARRLWGRIDADGVEVNGAAYAARSLVEDIERLEAENDRLRAEQAADRAAAKALVDALPKCMWDCDQTATGEDTCDGRQRVCDDHKCKRLGGAHVEEYHLAAPLRALQALMATWPSDGDRPSIVETNEQPSAEWDGIGLTPTIDRNEEWRARKRAEFIEMIRLAGDPGTSMLAVSPRYVGEFGDIDEPSLDTWNGGDAGAFVSGPVERVECTEMATRTFVPVYIPGEFDIDEPSVGDVEGYGLRR
jgi:hypothetical protein